MEHGRVWIANPSVGPIEARTPEEMLRLLVQQAERMVKSYKLAGYFSAERAKAVAELEAEFGDNSDVKGPSYEGENEGEDTK